MFMQVLRIRVRLLQPNRMQRSFLHSPSIPALPPYESYSGRLNFINGERLSGRGVVVKNVYPATGSEIGYFEESTSVDVDLAIKSSKSALEKWKNVAPLERGKILMRVGDLLRSDCEFMSYLETIDTGKPLWESRATVLECADSLQMFGGFATTLAGSHVHLPEDNFYYTRREPLGLCVGIGAWNFPIQMCVWKSAPALAAGNVLIFKPSPETPQTAVRLAELYIAAGLPPGVFNVVQASGGAGLSEHPEIRKLTFTGSVPTARSVLRGVSEGSLCPTTLELGGKSPLIIFPDADLDEALKGILLANFYSQGQVCSNAARVFVHRSIIGAVTEKLISAVRQFVVGDPMDTATHMGAMIHEKHGRKVLDYVKSAVKEGARLLHGGERLQFAKDSPLAGGFYIAPTILCECHDEMLAVKEEIFGPVLTLLPFEEEEEVVRRANHTVFGLAAGLFTRDVSRAHQVAAQLEAGAVYVNTFNAYPPGFPFGGSKLSGFGRENALETLQHFIHTKAVFVQTAKIGDLPFPTA